MSKTNLLRFGKRFHTRFVLLFSMFLMMASLGNTQSLLTGQYLYAVQTTTGDIAVYDINNNFAEVKKFPTVAGASNVDGVCASKATGRLYYSVQKNTGGYVVCVNLLKDSVEWEKKYLPGVDRLAITPDGKTLFVPTNEYVTTGEKFILIVDAINGNVIKTLDVSPKSHDAVIGISGKYAYQETKSSNLVAVINSGMDGQPIKVIQNIAFNGICHPISPNGSDTYLLANTGGVHGFQVGDVKSGKVVATATITGKPAPDTSKGNVRNNHGIAWTPDEKEAWVTEGGSVYVFDMTDPLKPRQTHEMVGKTTVNNAHWISFTIDGRFAFLTGGSGTPGTLEIWDARNKSFVGYLKNNLNSEYTLEIRFVNGVISEVGDQYGIGRVAAPTKLNSPKAFIPGRFKWSLEFRNGHVEIVTIRDDMETVYDAFGRH